MIEFILNNTHIKSDISPGFPLLDFIREKRLLHGTKIGCREGDCGACSVLVGEMHGNDLIYKSVVSCLSPMVNMHGKHVITIEGLNLEELSPIQESIENHSATQCGFCTPGFVISFYAYIFSGRKLGPIESIAGNICRCTGYKSLEKAAKDIEKRTASLGEKKLIESLVKEKWIPGYILTIPERLKKINAYSAHHQEKVQLMGGGTDLLVQDPEAIRKKDIFPVDIFIPKGISTEEGKVIIGAATSIEDFFQDEIIKRKLPDIAKVFKVIASSQIRNTGTLAGNIVNASPIGDLSILFLALNANLIIMNHKGGRRNIALKDFFLDYKKIDLIENEYIAFITLDEAELHQVNFEKVSKRTYLDIASVNSAINVSLKQNSIEAIHLSIGGISPYPKYMEKTVKFLVGKKLTKDVLKIAVGLIQEEIKPINDIRGSIPYKRLLARQLFLNHFSKLFSRVLSDEDLIQVMNSNPIEDEKY